MSHCWLVTDLSTTVHCRVSQTRDGVKVPLLREALTLTKSVASSRATGLTFQEHFLLGFLLPTNFNWALILCSLGHSLIILLNLCPATNSN